VPIYVGSLLVAYSSLFFIVRKHTSALLTGLVKVFMCLQAASPSMGQVFRMSKNNVSGSRNEDVCHI